MAAQVPWPVIPKDAIDHFRNAFAEANRVASERIVNVPNIRETSLDDTLIDALIPYSPPKRLKSGAVVEMDIHNIGGLRRLHSWEVADIAILVFIYRGSQLIAQKIGMLQTKRLFPKNKIVLDDDPVGFRYGMNAFLKRDAQSPLATLNRDFVFDTSCVYGSLQSGSDQAQQIDAMNTQFGKSVYYMFYNPPKVPVTIKFPVASRKSVKDVKLGCQVHTAQDVHAVLGTLKKGAHPDLKSVSQGTNWHLEEWVADHLLTCKVGRRFDSKDDAKVSMLLERRSGPIGAAIAVSIALSD